MPVAARKTSGGLAGLGPVEVQHGELDGGIVLGEGLPGGASGPASRPRGMRARPSRKRPGRIRKVMMPR